jgi:hypothetical protein
MMTSKSQIAWETAAQCATRAAEAADSEEREYCTRMRDAWTTLAKVQGLYLLRCAGEVADGG